MWVGHKHAGTIYTFTFAACAMRAQESAAAHYLSQKFGLAKKLPK